MTSEEQTLESINTTGTTLIECCNDSLSKDSVRESLSELNDKWGVVCGKLDDRVDKVKQGIALTDKYETLENEFQSWLAETEAKLDRPVSVTGSATEMQQIIRKLDVSYITRISCWRIIQS